MDEPYPGWRCVFCDKKATSREHAWPAWIAKEFRLQGFLSSYRRLGAAPDRKQPISVKNYRAKVFCETCQRFYKHREDAIKPILTPLGHGESRSITVAEQALLAEWGAKTAYAVFAFHKRRDDIPAEHRRYLREHREPTKNVLVAYSAYAGPARSTLGLLPLVDNVDEPPLAAYNLVAAFGRIALKVCCTLDDEAKPPAGIPGAIEQVWPARENEIAWPPPHVFDGSDFDTLIGFAKAK